MIRAALRTIAAVGLLLAPLVAAETKEASEAGVALQDRIDAAPAGGVVLVNGGHHQGPIRIDKPIALVGQNGALIDGGGQGHVIEVLASDARVEGFVITSSGENLSADHAGVMAQGERVKITGNRIENCLHGIYLKAARDCEVSNNRIVGKQTTLVPVGDVVADGLRLTPDGEMCIIELDINRRGNGIHLWNSVGNRIEENEISGTRDGIYFSFSDRTLVRSNYVHHVRYGLHYMYSDENVFEDNRFERNAAGAALMYSKGLFVRGNRFLSNQGRRAYGLLLQSLDDTTFIENQLERNTVGIYLENCNRNLFRSNLVADNYIGVRMTASSQQNGFTGNGFSRNLHSVELDRDSDANDWAPEGVGNYWTKARPVDLDGDGRGEFEHREADLLGRYRRSFPLAGLLSQTPSLQLLEFVQARARLPGVPAIRDPAPLARGPVKKHD